MVLLVLAGCATDTTSAPSPSSVRPVPVTIVTTTTSLEERRQHAVELCIASGAEDGPGWEGYCSCAWDRLDQNVDAGTFEQVEAILTGQQPGTYPLDVQRLLTYCWPADA